MQTESSYGWLVAPDPAARARLEAELEGVYAARDAEPGMPDGSGDWTEFEALLLVGRYVSNSQPLFSRLPFDYRLVPSPVRAAGLTILDRLHGSGAALGFPQWPSEQRLDNLRDRLWAGASALTGLPLVRPTYPGGRHGVVLLTHDIDSSAEVGGISDLRVLERRFGLPASFGFIPEMSWPDRGVVEELVTDGCEVYCHDVCHDGKLPYKSVAEIRAGFGRLFDAQPHARSVVRGFRSGQLLMTAKLLGVLAEFFDFDLSLPDTERGGPYGATAGCASTHPFLIDGLLEIPLTMPQDFYLANVDHYDSAGMQAIWREKLDAVLGRGGVAVVNTHPIWTNPRRPGSWAAYGALLETVAGADAWVTTPSALCDWLRGRRAGGPAGA